MQTQNNWHEAKGFLLEAWSLFLKALKALFGRKKVVVPLKQGKEREVTAADKMALDQISDTEGHSPLDEVKVPDVRTEFINQLIDKSAEVFLQLQVSATSWTVPKIGTNQDHNEDCVGTQIDSNGMKFRAVISDGASSTWCSKQWAQILVERFVGTFDESPFDWKDSRTWDESLKESKLLWETTIPRVQHDLAYLNELADEKQKVGAGACLIVLECDLATHTWRALAYGNCMFVHSRLDEILICGPLDKPEQFEGFTPLVSSGATAIKDESHLWTRTGEFRDGDDFFLLTDELAKWTVMDSLSRHVDALRKVDSQSSAEAVVAALRQLREVQDDDMSAIHVVLEALTK